MANRWFRLCFDECINTQGWAKLTEQILDSREKAVMYNAGKLAGEQFAKTLLKAGLKEKELKLALEISLTNGGWGEVRPLPC